MDDSDYIFTSEGTFMSSSVTTRPTPVSELFNDVFILCSFAVWLLKWSPAIAGKL